MTELSTCKGSYLPGEAIELTLVCDSAAAEAQITVTRLEHEVWRGKVALTGLETRVALPPLAEGGYGVEARLTDNSGFEAVASTAVNVGGKIVRYGFLCDFLPHGDGDVDCLAKYHIDHVQFYDWDYRHDTLVAPTDEYADMMGKRSSLPVIRQKIAACQERGMKAMAYAAVYAASREFWEAHRDWGLYAGPGKPMTFIDTFYYMDIESPWREHLFRQYADAVQRVGFNGLHMDTYGEPKRALTEMGETRELETGLPALIRDADSALREAGCEPHLIFNNVGAWPVAATRGEPQDAVYMELWPPMDRYRHLRQAVAQALPAGKPVVLAAYPAPFRTDTPERALASELILSFAIALAGATQLFLGEENAVVTQGYYADYARLLPWQIERIQAYQDFFVRYQDLFFDQSLRDVSLTHACGDNCEYGCNQLFSPEGEPGRLWLTFRESGARKMIGLINLTGVSDDHWNTGKETPTPVENITLHALALHPVKQAWFASPDAENGAAVPLECVCRDADYGVDVAIRLPKLDVCGLVWLETE